MYMTEGGGAKKAGTRLVQAVVMESRGRTGWEKGKEVE